MHRRVAKLAPSKTTLNKVVGPHIKLLTFGTLNLPITNRNRLIYPKTYTNKCKYEIISKLYSHCQEIVFKQIISYNSSNYILNTIQNKQKTTKHNLYTFFYKHC